MRRSADRTHDVPTQIKNPDLVEKRRRQIVDAAVALFVEKGFHKTTTRQIAAAAGFSIGSLYEYVASKEDVLYLVCEAIHDEVEHGVAEALARVTTGRAALAEVIREYFLVCHRMSDLVLLIYQETQSLPSQWRKRVLENEISIDDKELEILSRSILGVFDQYVKLNKKVPAEILTSLSGIDEPSRMSDTIAAHMSLKLEEK